MHWVTGCCTLPPAMWRFNLTVGPISLPGSWLLLQSMAMVSCVFCFVWSLTPHVLHVLLLFKSSIHSDPHFVTIVYLTTTPPSSPYLALTLPSPHPHTTSPHLHTTIIPYQPTFTILVPMKGIHIIGAHNLVVEPETAWQRADVLEGGSVVLTAAPEQPGHKISLDFEKVVHVKTIKLQGTQWGPVCSDSTDGRRIAGILQNDISVTMYDNFAVRICDFIQN